MAVDDGRPEGCHLGGVERLERGDELAGAFAGRAAWHGLDYGVAAVEQPEPRFGVGRRPDAAAIGAATGLVINGALVWTGIACVAGWWFA